MGEFWLVATFVLCMFGLIRGGVEGLFAALTASLGLGVLLFFVSLWQVT